MTRYEIKYIKTESFDKTLTLVIEAQTENEALKIVKDEDIEGLFAGNDQESLSIIDIDLDDFDPEPLESIQMDSIEELKE